MRDKGFITVSQKLTQSLRADRFLGDTAGYDLQNRVSPPSFQLIAAYMNSRQRKFNLKPRLAENYRVNAKVRDLGNYTANSADVRFRVEYAGEKFGSLDVCLDDVRRTDFVFSEVRR